MESLPGIERSVGPGHLQAAGPASISLVYVNAAFARLTGYRESEALGRPSAFLEGPETYPATAAQLREAIETGQELRVHVRHYRRDGHPFWSETFLSPVIDPSGSISHYISADAAMYRSKRRPVGLP